MAAATRLVDELDRRALAAKRRVTRALAAEVLATEATEALPPPKQCFTG